jgi:short chain dehydrogenase
MPPACKVFFTSSIRTYCVQRDSDLDAFESEPIHWPMALAPRDLSHSGNFVMTDLAGKTALVTGASRGIGRATALGLANGGAQVLVHYASGQAEAAAVVAQIRQAGGRAEMVAADLRSLDGPHALAKRVRTIVGDHGPHITHRRGLETMNQAGGDRGLR